MADFTTAWQNLNNALMGAAQIKQQRKSDKDNLDYRKDLLGQQKRTIDLSARRAGFEKARLDMEKEAHENQKALDAKRLQGFNLPEAPPGMQISSMSLNDYGSPTSVNYSRSVDGNMLPSFVEVDDGQGGTVKLMSTPTASGVPSYSVAPKPKGSLSEGDKALIANIGETRRQLMDLDKIIQRDGNYESPVLWGNTDSRAALSSLPLSIAIGLSKIVDPATAAREGEVEAAKKFAIPLPQNIFTAPLIRNETTRAAIQQKLDELTRRQQMFNSLREIEGLPLIDFNKVSVGPTSDLYHFKSPEEFEASGLPEAWVLRNGSYERAVRE